MTTWDTLVADALLGTERRPPSALEVDGRLGEVVAGLGAHDNEERLLGTAAAVALHRRAGRRPAVVVGALPRAAEPEKAEQCSEAASDRLDQILHGRFREVLPEYLDAVSASGRRLPFEHLPAVLDMARVRRDLRDVVTRLAGERGRWLAGCNPAWAYAAGGDDVEETWRTGGPEARRAVLERMRAADAAAGRALLESTWATEEPTDRSAFISLLATGLSADDEAFLEAGLDNRRREVRQAAAELLAALPTSRLAQRMAARVAPLVSIGGRVRKRLDAKAPDPPDAAMLRDGIVAKPPKGQGERAWWLEQLIAATPLSTWTETLGHAPADLVKLADAGDAAVPVLRGWAAASVRQRDGAWATALLPAVDAPGLVDALVPARAQEVALDAVTAKGLASPTVIALLDACRPPWSVELSGAVVREVARVVRTQRTDAGAVLRTRLADWARRVDHRVAEAALERVRPEPGEFWYAAGMAFVDTVAFRHDMHEELEKP